MSRRRKLLLIASCLAILCVAVVIYISSAREPSYGGKRLSEWVDAFNDGRVADEPIRTDAIRHMGTRALPFLLAWNGHKTSFFDRLIDRAISNSPAWIARNQPIRGWIERRAVRKRRANNRAEYSIMGFRALGSAGAPAIPELVQRINSPKNVDDARLAIRALAYLGPDAVPPLKAVLADSKKTEDYNAVGYVALTWTNALPLIPMVIGYLQHTNEWVAIDAAHTLGLLGGQRFGTELVIPGLLKALDDPRDRVRIEVVRSLGWLRNQGKAALPEIVKLLNDPQWQIRQEATNAVRMIDPQRFQSAW